MSKIKEIWQPVVGREQEYEVSNKGGVRSLLRGGRNLRPGMASNGYPTVALGRGRTRTIHSLVAEAFIGPRPTGQEVMHLDGDRKNACAANLRYGTRSENNAQIFKDGRRKITAKQLRWARQRLAAGASGVSVAKELGLSQSQISNIKHGRQYIDD